MSTAVRSDADLVRAMKVLAVARTIMSYNRDRDLIEKVTVLQGYVELTTMFPDRDYRLVTQKAVSELAGVIYGTLKCEEIEQEVAKKRTALFQRSREYAVEQGLLLAD